MNGVHDMGGMHGFGPVVREAHEPVFHAPWEGVVYAINRLRGWLGYSIDESRYAIESMPPQQYLASSYYERWLYGVERNLLQKGLITREELEAKLAYFRAHPDAEVPRREDPARLAELERELRAPARFARPVDSPPRFRVGDAVLTRRDQPRGHTRLPRYARGRRGVIHAHHGGYIFPDTHAHGLGEHPQHLYTVCFEAAELWGASAEPNERIYLDLWESYLEPAP